MRIVMEQGGPTFGNLGDWAMLEVSIKRCRTLFPGCEIHVFAKDAHRVRECIPEVTPLASLGQTYLLGDGPLLGRWGSRFWNLDRTFVRAWPRIAMPMVRFRHWLWGYDVRDLDALIELTKSADLVMASGGGYITDEFPNMVKGVCGILRLAQGLGKPTAMFGQGLGPLENSTLRRSASKTLQNLQVLSLREGLWSTKVAASLGVSQDQMTITGDDAVEPAYEMRPASLGDRLGLNVRVARYSSVDTSDVDAIRQAVKRILDDVGALPQILPISLDEDYPSTGAILPPGHEQNDGNVQCPQDVIRLAGQCRLVITGSYHAGVFALAQGVPVLAIAKSDYYAHKFEGLASQFGVGCRVLRMGIPDFSRLLHETAVQMWHDADGYRPQLLAQARVQIERSTAAYERLANQMALAA